MKIKLKDNSGKCYLDIKPGTCFRFEGRQAISMKTDEGTFVDLEDGMMGECNLSDKITVVSGTFVEE